MPNYSVVSVFVRALSRAALVAVFAFMLNACMDDPKPFAERFSTSQLKPGVAKPVKQGDYWADYWTLSTANTSVTVTALGDFSMNFQLAKTTTNANESDSQSYLSWTEAGGSGDVFDFARLKHRINSVSQASSYQWLAPINAPSLDSGATQTTLTAIDDIDASAVVMWDSAGMVKTQDFMSGMNHFMASMAPMQVGAIHSARMLVHGGEKYIVGQQHVNDGFNLQAYSLGANGWQGVALPRIGDATNPIGLNHDDLVSSIDGAEQVRVVWRETQAGDVRLMTAAYDTLNSSWSEASVLIDSAVDNKGVDLANITAMSLSAEHGSANFHLLVYVDSASNQLLYSMDQSFDANGALIVGAPMRRDLVDSAMDGMISIVGKPRFAIYHSTHVATWIENHMGEQSIKLLRFSATSHQWEALESVALPGAGNSMDALAVGLNHDGMVSVAWTEKNASHIVIAASHHDGIAWSQKEFIAEVAGEQLLALNMVLNDADVPWLAWAEASANAGNAYDVSIKSSGRKLAVNFNNGKDAGTAAVGSHLGSVAAGSDYADGYWGSIQNLAMLHEDPALNSHIAQQQLQIVDPEAVFVSWTKANNDGASFSLQRRMDSNAMPPLTLSATAQPLQFLGLSPSLGYALWRDGGVIHVSQLSDASGTLAFGADVSLGEGYAARLVGHASEAYVVVQRSSNSDGSFAIDIYDAADGTLISTKTPLERTPAGVDPLQQNADDLIAAIDGSDHIRVIWRESEGTSTRLMTASFDTMLGMEAWNTAAPLLDSGANSHGVSVADIQSMSVSAPHGTADFHLLLFVSTADNEMIYSLDQSVDLASGNIGTVVDPVRRDIDAMMLGMDGMMSIVGAPAYATYHSSHVVTWLQKHTMTGSSGMPMDMYSIHALRLNVAAASGTDPWLASEEIALAADMAAVSNLGIALNHAGTAVTYWLEKDAQEQRLMAALLPQGASAWSMKERVHTIALNVGVSNLVGAIRDSDTPVLSWTETSDMGGMTMLSVQYVERKIDASDTLAKGTAPSNG